MGILELLILVLAFSVLIGKDMFLSQELRADF